MLARFGQVMCLALVGFASATLAVESARPTVDTAVQADGSVSFDGERFEGANAIETKLLELATRQPPPVLRPTANKGASYQTIRTFLEAVQKAGLKTNMVGISAPAN